MKIFPHIIKSHTCTCYIKVYFVRWITSRLYCEHGRITPVSSQEQNTVYTILLVVCLFSLHDILQYIMVKLFLNMLFRCISRGLHFDDDVYRKVVMNDKWRFSGLLSCLLWFSRRLSYMLPSDYALLSIVIFFPRHTCFPLAK